MGTALHFSSRFQIMIIKNTLKLNRLFCVCNSVLWQHTTEARHNLIDKTITEWNFKECTEDDGDTDAYGEIIFLVKFSFCL